MMMMMMMMMAEIACSSINNKPKSTLRFSIIQNGPLEPCFVAVSDTERDQSEICIYIERYRYYEQHSFTHTH